MRVTGNQYQTAHRPARIAYPGFPHTYTCCEQNGSLMSCASNDKPTDPSVLCRGGPSKRRTRARGSPGSGVSRERARRADLQIRRSSVADMLGTDCTVALRAGSRVHTVSSLVRVRMRGDGVEHRLMLGVERANQIFSCASTKPQVSSHMQGVGARPLTDAR